MAAASAAPAKIDRPKGWAAAKAASKAPPAKPAAWMAIAVPMFQRAKA